MIVQTQDGPIVVPLSRFLTTPEGDPVQVPPEEWSASKRRLECLLGSELAAALLRRE